MNIYKPVKSFMGKPRKSYHDILVAFLFLIWLLGLSSAVLYAGFAWSIFEHSGHGPQSFPPAAFWSI